MSAEVRPGWETLRVESSEWVQLKAAKIHYGERAEEWEGVPGTFAEGVALGYRAAAAYVEGVLSVLDPVTT